MSARATSDRGAVHRLLAVSAVAALAVAGALGAPLPAHAANVEVTTLADSGAGSLRDAVAIADVDAGVDTVTFQPGQTGTIELATTLSIIESLTIDATGADITVSRVNGASFDLVVADFGLADRTLTLVGFEISNDAAAPIDGGRGLVVRNGSGDDVGDVTLTDMTFANHDGGTPSGGGGAISVYESSNLTITRGSISSNQVGIGLEGGGLYFAGGGYGSLTIDGTDFVSNRAGGGGAFLVEDVDQVTVRNATFQLNRSAGNFPIGHGGAGEIRDIGIAGVTIENTVFDENAAELYDGGALRIAGVTGPVDVSGSSFRNNRAAGLGGALISGTTGAVGIEDSEFSDNSSGGTGGAAFVEFVAGPVRVEGSTFGRNVASSGDAGGLYLGNVSGAVTVNRTSFVDNEAGDAGGGARINGVSAASTISDTEFIGNTADAAGGGLQVSYLDDDLAIALSTFSGNDAGGGGVALDVVDVLVGSGLTIDSSTFDGNTPAVLGAQDAAAVAIGTLAGTVTIVNSTVSEPADLPAIFLDAVVANSGFSLTHSTVVSDANALSIVSLPVGTFRVRNSILVGEDLDGAIDIGTSTGGVLSVWWSIVSSDQGPTVFPVEGVQFSTDPNLAPLADNGGPTQTRLLLAGSPARDLGDPAFVAPPTVDQRGAGYARVLNGRLDIGAVEVAAVLPPTGQTVSWWLLPVAGGVLLLGVIAVLLVRLRGAGRRRA